MQDRERMLRFEDEQRVSDRKWRLFEMAVFIGAGIVTAAIGAVAGALLS